MENSLMSRTWWIAMILACLVAFPAAGQQVVQKSDNLVEVTVTGAGMDKDEAIREALRQAVERGAGSVIYSESETRDFELIRDTVLARSTGFVQSHEVLSTRKLIDGT